MPGDKGNFIWPVVEFAIAEIAEDPDSDCFVDDVGDVGVAVPIEFFVCEVVYVGEVWSVFVFQFMDDVEGR